VVRRQKPQCRHMNDNPITCVLSGEILCCQAKLQEKVVCTHMWTTFPSRSIGYKTECVHGCC
jgi:hypothetical protein